MRGIHGRHVQADVWRRHAATHAHLWGGGAAHVGSVGLAVCLCDEGEKIEGLMCVLIESVLWIKVLWVRNKELSFVSRIRQSNASAGSRGVCTQKQTHLQHVWVPLQDLKVHQLPDVIHLQPGLSERKVTRVDAHRGLLACEALDVCVCLCGVWMRLFVVITSMVAVFECKAWVQGHPRFADTSGH